MSNWSRVVQGNANTFAIGNLNQFQVSPFTPTTTTDFTVLSNSLSTFSTCCGNVSTVFNFTTYTLSISTIVPISSDSSQTVTMNATTLQMNANAMNMNIDTALTISTPLITFSTLVGSTITANTISCSRLQISTISTNTTSPLTITNDVTITGCAQFRGCVSTISTSVVLDSNLWGKCLFVNKAEQSLTLSLNTLASSGTYMVIKNVASTIGNNVTVNVAPYGDFSTYTISSFSTLRLMSMPDGWYSV
jgi:hypothetical protein